MFWKRIILLPFICFLFSAFNQEEKGLKDYYRAYFPIGVAVSAQSLKGEEGRFILKHFNSITPENAMKMAAIHPSPNYYDWRDADSIVAFATKNKLKVRGHTLCWHEHNPQWIFKHNDGSQVSRDVLLTRLRNHIHTVVSRYKGKIYAWDVVNEAIDDDDNKLFRNSEWFKLIGEDYVAKAFEYAHEADPNALLFYNDYNTERPKKRERIYSMLQQLIKKGVPIHGVGLQGHWSLEEASEKELQNTVSRFSALGLQVQITELDVNVYPWEGNKRALKSGEQQAYTSLMETQQTAKYKEIFRILRTNKKTVTGVTFWNVSDRSTWLDEFPVMGRKNYPLLFDARYKPKKAYWEVVKFSN